MGPISNHVTIIEDEPTSDAALVQPSPEASPSPDPPQSSDDTHSLEGKTAPSMPHSPKADMLYGISHGNASGSSRPDASSARSDDILNGATATKRPITSSKKPAAKVDSQGPTRQVAASSAGQIRLNPAASGAHQQQQAQHASAAQRSRTGHRTPSAVPSQRAQRALALSPRAAATQRAQHAVQQESQSIRGQQPQQAQHAQQDQQAQHAQQTQLLPIKNEPMDLTGQEHDYMHAQFPTVRSQQGQAAQPTDLLLRSLSR